MAISFSGRMALDLCKLPELLWLVADFATTISSENEFHTPQFGHFPIQRGDSNPQSLQINIDFCFNLVINGF